MMASRQTDSQSRPAHPNPRLLELPATIISPPSPVNFKTSHSEVFDAAPVPPSTDEPVEYDSPEEDDSVMDLTASPRSPPLRRPSYSSLSPSPWASPRPISSPSVQAFASPRLSSGPVAAAQLSTSPTSTPGAFLHPASPEPGSSSSRLSTPGSPRKGSRPSSPQYRPRPSDSRRESSTHRVRETTYGEQKETVDGRMVNQYRIGRKLGNGAYATVELGVDQRTGTEYVSVELFFGSRRLRRA
jgi:hypothetical protein